jgi:hypothetical protein
MGGLVARPGERGGQLLPKLLRPGALKSEEQRQELRSQAGEVATPEAVWLACC